MNFIKNINENKIKYLPGKNSIKKVIDNVGYIFFNRNKQNLFLNIDEFKSIGIVNLGHIGDILLMLPMLEKLREKFKGKITLIINPYTREIVENIKFIDDIVIIEHPKFSRSKNTSWKKTIKSFRDINVDLLLETDVYTQVIPFAYLAKKKYFIGFNSSGFGFLFDVVLDYPFNKHISEKYFRFLEFFGISKPLIKSLENYIKDIYNPLKDIDNYITIAIGAGAQSRDWDDIYFIDLIQKLISDKHNVVIVGKMNRKRENKYKNIKSELVTNLINKTNLRDAFGIIRDSKAFLGLESGLTHAAAMLKVKTIALYSGTTSTEIWKPFNLDNNVYIITADVPCKGCGKDFCEDNICMKWISVDVVYNKLKYIL